ncbi:MAG: transketolase [Chloroflexi bacterium]|nr:transketolase [Chloroflexota bacterium]
MNCSDARIARYKAFATQIRAHVLRMTHRAKSSHIGGCFSIADLLAVLYNGILQVDHTQPNMPDRDRFIISKGHVAAAVYATLAERGFFPLEWLDTFYQDGSHLPGHVTYGVPGAEASTGSLGHGLSISCGIALAGKRDNRSYRVFTLLGDGECDEGSIWEAALFAPHHHLDNLVAIIDYNKIQSFGMVKEVLDLDPLAEKWRAFGWAVKEIDGHDINQIENSLQNVPFEPEQPSCIIAHTIKGKGISFMENQLAWHYRHPNDEELQQALAELGVSE